MSELSDFHTVEDAAELAEHPSSNGVHATNHATNGANGAAHGIVSNGVYDGHSAHAFDQEAIAEVANADAHAVIGLSSGLSSGATQPELRVPSGDTWGPDLPSLRIGQVGAAGGEAAGSSSAIQARVAPMPVYDLSARPPRALRPTRLVAGLVLLLGAWLATVGALLLGRSVLTGLPDGMDLPFQIGLYILTALGALWLVVVALACLATAAFALSLAVTTRRW